MQVEKIYSILTLSYTSGRKFCLPDLRVYEKCVHEIKPYLTLLEETFPGITSTIRHCEPLGFNWGGEGRLFVKEENGLAISHVGYFESPALIEGKSYTIGALHAICTRASHQNQGHASELILEALRWAEGRTHCVILFTAIPAFYRRLGFHPVQEYRFHLPCNHIKGTQHLRQVRAPVDNALFLRCFRERAPLSERFCIQDHGALASFNSLFGNYPVFGSLYYSQAFDGFLAYVLEGKTLHLWDVVAKKIPSLEEILDHFSSPLENIYFYFSPDKLVRDAKAEPYLHDHAELLVHGSLLAEHPFMIAPLSRC